MNLTRRSPFILPVENPSIEEKYSPQSTSRKYQMRLPRTVWIVVSILCIGILLTVVNIYQLRQMQKEHWDRSHGGAPTVEAELGWTKKKRPVFWLKASNPDSGYLDHVLRVLERAGLVRGRAEEEWDVLWHHDYPFLETDMRPILTNLKPHQKVNHIPGSGYYTSKVNLATSNISGIPPAFGLPDEKEKFLDFSRKHPDKLWVQKSNKHRGIQIRKIQDLDLGQESSFIQEYISNPLLIDGRKFDIGVYTMVTSIAPLRVSIYEGDILFRFCPKDYHPFDPADVDKYVIGDEYTPLWEMKSLENYFKEIGMTFRGSFDAHLKSAGKDSEIVWEKIRETIRQVFQAKQMQILDLIGKYKYHWNFFELSRFDFVIDEDLNVFLMEANMSPNLSSGHFPANKLIYEQVLFNLFSVVGVARALHSTSLMPKSKDEDLMIVSDKDIQVAPDLCQTSVCLSCNELHCKTCNKCLDEPTKDMLRRAYLEHINRYNTRRVLPKPLGSQENARNIDKFKISLMALKTNQEKIVAWWFRGKCLQDVFWCL